jgi:hypothetical protein
MGRQRHHHRPMKETTGSVTSSFRDHNTSGSISSQRKDEEYYRCMLSSSLAHAETRVVNCLRVAVFLVLILTGALMCTGVYLYTSHGEQDDFRTAFQNSAHQVVESFHDSVQRNLGAVASLSSSVTSFAASTNATFPFVTMPDFEVWGSHVRDLSGSHVIYWLPMVTDEQRGDWEVYAMQHRSHVDESFQKDALYRTQQDKDLLGDSSGNSSGQARRLQQQPPSPLNMTILGDGTGYHPHIWSPGAVSLPGDEPPGQGPYFPVWQRSPIDAGRQAMLNMNAPKTAFTTLEILENVMVDQQVILNQAAYPSEATRPIQEANLAISQYREHVQDLISGLSTFVMYPVFDSFDEETKKVVGVMATK